MRHDCIDCEARRLGENCDAQNAVNCKKLSDAKGSLEKAVHSSWMALIKEAILNETVEDESNIVSDARWIWRIAI